MLGGEHALPFDGQQGTAVQVYQQFGEMNLEEGELGSWIPEVSALLDGESLEIGRVLWTPSQLHLTPY